MYISSCKVRLSKKRRYHFDNTLHEHPNFTDIYTFTANLQHVHFSDNLSYLFGHPGLQSYVLVILIIIT
jgi:hypothetical protein